MKDEVVAKRMLIMRVNTFNEDRAKSKLNANDSPMFDILNIAERLDLLVVCLNMVLNGHYYDKKTWNKIVWEKSLAPRR